MPNVSVATSPLLSSDITTRQTAYRLNVSTDNLDALPDAVRSAIKYAVLKGCLDLKAGVQLEIRNKNLIKTGNLLNSVTIIISEDGMTGTVIVGAYYGIYLEFGTIHMSAKPFFAPAIDAFAPSWSEGIAANVASVLAGLGQ